MAERTRQTRDRRDSDNGGVAAESGPQLSGEHLSRWMRGEEGDDPLLGVDLIATQGRRLRYALGLRGEDCERIAALHQAVLATEPESFEQLAQQLLSDKVLQPCCGGDTELEQMRFSLADFFTQLRSCRFVEDEAIRRRVDFVLRHRLLGLRSHWFLAAHEHYLALASGAVLHGDYTLESAAETMQSVQRAVLFDLGLVLMAYVFAGRSRVAVSGSLDYGSPSRRRKDFITRLDRLLRGEEEPSGATVVVVGIENLHQINTIMGHQMGDLVMQQTASRLVSCMRETDFLQRIGVTELGIALPGVVQEPLATLASRKFSKALIEPLRVGGRELHLKPALGVAIGPAHGEDGSTVFQNAELAMREAARGHGQLLFFDDALRERSRMLYGLEGELRRAAENQELRMVYQPQADLRTGEVIGCEALLRWRSAKYGDVPPDRFIGIAEESGLIHALTGWVLQSALREFATGWGEGTAWSVSVNISAVNLRDPDLPKAVARVLSTWDVEPQRVCIEITESMFLESPETALKSLEELSRIGVRISIDDFGTGYSSLAYLQRLPVDEIKIDRSFVRNLLRESGDAQIASTIIALGHNFGLQVLAEGVEDEETRARLLELGCDRYQGYLLGKPMPPEELAAYRPR